LKPGQRRSRQALCCDDAELVLRCREGSARAWAEIVGRYERLVYAIPLKEGLSSEEAADVAQETFAALLAGLDRIKQPDRLGSWLMTVARRLSWAQRNRTGRHTLVLSDVDLGTDEELGADLVRALWVHDAVRQLGEPCRSLVLSLFFDPGEPSYAEIAVRLGRPLGSVGPLRARCLDRLKALLEDA